jgi:uncharacterized membrane protein
VIAVDMSADQAMAMIISGGVVGPDTITYAHRPDMKPIELPRTGT